MLSTAIALANNGAISSGKNPAMPQPIFVPHPIIRLVFLNLKVFYSNLEMMASAINYLHP